MQHVVSTSILSDMEACEHAVLTRAQQRFAADVNAKVGPQCDRNAVCMYREVAEATIRWIVDADGHVLDLATFGH